MALDIIPTDQPSDVQYRSLNFRFLGSDQNFSSLGFPIFPQNRHIPVREILILLARKFPALLSAIVSLIEILQEMAPSDWFQSFIINAARSSTREWKARLTFIYKMLSRFDGNFDSRISEIPSPRNYSIFC